MNPNPRPSARRRSALLPAGLLAVAALVLGNVAVVRTVLGPATGTAAPGAPGAPGVAVGELSRGSGRLVPAPSPAAGVEVPLVFEANRGQAGADVAFLARGQSVGLAVTSTGALVGLDGGGVRLAPRGAAPASAVVGLEPQAGRVNYFTGSDPSRWTAGVPTYGRVAQKGVYPGIDLEYYGRGRDVEYDVVVAPGADPAAVRLGLEGASALHLDGAGNLVADTAAGSLTQRRPVAYQDVDGQRVGVAAGFVVRSGDEVGFELAPYDTSRTLVIDPTLVYSTFLGGGGNDNLQHVAVDSAGYVYVTGNSLYNPTPYPATPGSFDPTFVSVSGDRDVVVTKLSPAGAMVWSTFLGGTAGDSGFGIAVHTDGTVYVTGSTASTNFPVVNAFDSTFNGGTTDSFVTKFAADGASLVFSTYLGSNGSDQPNTGTIALDATGAVYTVGQTAQASSTTKWPTTAGAYQTVFSGPNGRADAYLTKLTPAGAMEWSTLLGSLGTDNAYGVAVDATGVYVAGSTTSGAASQGVFPTTPGAYDTTYGGGTGADAFVTKFTLNGSALIYSTYIGAGDVDTAQAITIDGAGNAYLAGVASTGFPTTPGAYDTTYNGGQDGWVGELSADGSQLLYSTFLGSPIGDALTGIARDSAGSLYVTGSTGASGWPVTADAFDGVFGGGTGSDAVLTKIKPAGLGPADLEYSTYIGSATGETGRGPALDGQGNVWVVGYTNSPDFPVTATAIDKTLDGGTNSEGWVMEFNFGPPPDTTPPETTIDSGPPPLTNSTSVTFTFSTNEPATFECSLDGSSFAACTSPQSYTGLADGPHTFEVRAVDTAANVDQSPATATFVVDATPPVATIDSAPTTPWNSAAATFFFSANEPATFECSLDGSPFSACASPLTYTNLSEGTHTFQVRATDTAGNLGVPPAAATFAVHFLSLPAVVTGSTSWTLRTSFGVEYDTIQFSYGTRPLVPMLGDWDGDGVKTPATYEGGVFKLRNSNSAGPPDITFAFGDPRAFPVAGDFDGDHKDDVALYRNGVWQIRYTATGTSIQFGFGSGTWPSTVPVAGDWDGDGKDGIGVYNYATGAWQLRNQTSAGAADLSFTYTQGSGSYGVVGDWDGDGVDTVGVKLGGTWYLRNSNSGGAPDVSVAFGLANDLPLVWTNQ